MEVYAFIGPSGTGKSQRALPLALSYNIRYIIDDGLLIKDGRIIAGVSAKSELSKVRAIRRALFQFEDHREAVVSKIKEESPEKILIIATSEEMAQKICRNLNLPDPNSIIYIYDVASPGEISQARQERERSGKHVIPVPLVEVERGFRGQLVGRIRLFFSGKREEVGEKVIVRPPFSLYGRLSITEDALKSLIGFLIKEHSPYVLLKNVSLRFPEEGSIEVDLRVEVVYGVSIKVLLKGLQFYLKNRVEEITGMVINEVNIEVVGIKIGIEFRRKVTAYGGS
ncbi:MAG: Asp23/Gls24 family envelope stress response protein [Synergistetes bacterium]|nr:Asp23/Gls24 family envelope stress response protein [Synergistota bacterium]MCX8127934.1 Asp23/Gls24 family envelope stress response protein [Synergistota bacterium]MDW8192025.1 Asp23/Gls24 family envelope stress response protein [Synergistota bacterium]